MQTIIDTASSTIATNLGFSFQDVTTFMSGLLSTVIGAGLGVLQVLLPYILGLIVVTAIVYFIYRAFRFFRH
jgi:hypothetical protein